MDGLRPDCSIRLLDSRFQINRSVPETKGEAWSHRPAGYSHMTDTNSPTSLAVTDGLVSILRDDLELPCQSLSATTRLVDDLGMDSVSFAVGLVSIEEKFGVQLSEEDLITCRTVGDLQSVIDQRSAA
ncbi:acyl carrier protein [Mycolicibacterium septicum]|uniref:acyl carrier protein n=1 Tax=Mycolicibacterium septicum TaxID=98668 RepID=UPI0023E0FB44|nr:acyl carrier protein [Mycolicibacterium septicum]MDF3337958.1 acyl carrier protein [Mycolicibacterium septicum]